MRHFVIAVIAALTLAGCAANKPAEPQKQELPKPPKGYMYVECRHNVCLDYYTGQFFGFTENSKDGIYLVWAIDAQESI